MTRRAFLSFHYKPDNWRAQQVKQMGKVEGQPILSSNKWEAIKQGGESAIKSWIDKEMAGKSCQVLLIGSKTAGRKWIKYEIKKAWADGKGIVGVYIHNLKDADGVKSSKGRNPLSDFTVSGKDLDSIVKAYNPPSTNAYNHIDANLAAWVEEAIQIRNNFTS
ncbi:MAG TPA: TIR domain-containing protein [Streptosporangiaceae bacterium]|jgi:hypothetical protein